MHRPGLPLQVPVHVRDQIKSLNLLGYHGSLRSASKSTGNGSPENGAPQHVTAPKDQCKTAAAA